MSTPYYTTPTSKETVLARCKEGSIVAIKVQGTWVTGRIDIYLKPFEGRNDTDKLMVYIEEKHNDVFNTYTIENFTDIIMLEQPQ
jgi:hypothetical protein